MLGAWSPRCQSSDSLPSELAPNSDKKLPLLWEETSLHQALSPLSS